MKLKEAKSFRMLPLETRVRVLTHMDDVDGLVSAALVLRRFPNALIKTFTKWKKMKGEYDIIVDLPLLKSLKTHVWIDHHRGTIQEGKCEERVHDSDAKSAASLLAKYLNLKEDELVGIANRADSASYLTDAPLDFKKSYDPAWDVNDAVKAITSSRRFGELAKVLAREELEGVRRKFKAEISHIRRLRRKAEKIVQMLSKRVEEQKPDSMILLMPKAERRGSAIGGYIVFSLYRKGLKAFAMFTASGFCWINVRKGFKKIDCFKVVRRYEGTGHRFVGGAQIGIEKLDEIKHEFKKAGLKPMIVDLRKLSW
jgi:oligoribonuclease NrnB/cAMP/cGMP phosphodiesterase (DHH superfamily)